MPLFLHSSTPEKLSSVGAMVLDRLRRVGESVAAIAGIASPSSSQTNNGVTSTSQVYHDEWLATPSSPSPEPLEVAAEQAGSHISAIQAPTPPYNEEEERKRHAAHMLDVNGIKVRDFAYESKLPPVPVPRLGFGGQRRPLKRTWEELDEEEEYHSGETEDREAKRQKLQRELTEPIPSSQNMPPSQREGFGTLKDLSNASLAMGDSDGIGETAPQASTSRQQLPVADQPDAALLDWPVDFGSEEPSMSRPEGWIDTPPLTPGGSYAPMPQVEAASVGSLMDLDPVETSQEPAATEPHPFPEVEQTQSFPSIPAVVQSTTLTSLFSSLTSLPSSPAPLLPSPSRSCSFHGHTSLRDISMNYNVRSPSSPSPTPTPRYLLRNRVGASPVSRSGSRRLSNAGLSSRPQTRKPRSSVAKRATGSVKATSSKPVRRSPRNKGSRATRR